jgi:hypothetical protein
MDSAEKVRQEMDRFYAALPDLKKTLADRWVVYRDGVVHSDHMSEIEAYLAAVKQFGLDGAFVVAQVVDVKPTPLSAAYMFGV